MQYPKIHSLVPAGEFFDETAIGEGVYLTATHLTAIETELSKVNEADAQLQQKLDDAVAENTNLKEQLNGMHTEESVQALNSRIAELENQVAELGKQSSGNGSHVEGSSVVETEQKDGKKLTINDPEHPMNQEAARYLQSKQKAKAAKPKF